MATTKLQALWNHPAGPKTIHFWAPTFKWGISIANIADFQKPPETLSYPQQMVITGTGLIWSRYSTVITPEYQSFRIGSDGSLNYDATRAYALSKLANVLHTIELSLVLHKMDANVTANCVHSGIVRTRLTRDGDGLITDFIFFLTSKLLKSVPQAAATTCYVAASPKLRNVCGKYFSECNEARTSKSGSCNHKAQRLWTASELLVTPPSTPNVRSSLATS
uniref:Mitochondrial pyruvate carrier n=1 Tax=Brassica campestris TaxID=3711 RepID=M4EL05_BRACM